jgi:ATPase subunit of ABC transporter with duplicated ATPase domains
MTDAQELTTASMDGSAQVIVNDQSLAREEIPAAPVQQSSQQAESVSQEKMIPQSQVNEIIKARLAKERESAAKSESNQQPDAHQQHSTNNAQPDISQTVAQELDRRLQEMQASQQHEAALSEAKKTLESLTVKIDEAASKYDDFEEVTKDVPYSSFPGLLTAANTVENSGDVLYHLGKNPSKMRELASSFQPIQDPNTGQMVANPMAQVAMKELRQLSDSMRNNEIAKQKNLPREPLGQIRPSNVGADNGKSSISQLRQKWTV